MEETRILVVDDEQEIADLELYLISDGYQVIKSEDALEDLRLWNVRRLIWCCWIL